MENVLEVKNIEKYYGNKSNLTKAIDNISFNVQKGEFEKNRIIHEIQKEEDSKKEFMLLGLRKIDGRHAII